MPLRKEFAETIAKALALRKRTPEGDHAHRIFLHQAIVGPPNTGKTYLAKQYIRALQQNGLANKNIVLAEPRYYDQIIGDIRQAKGGVLLVDGWRGLYGADMQGNALPHLREAIVKNECTVILLGDEKFLADITRDPGISRRMNPPIILTPEAETALSHPIHTRKPLTFRQRKEGEPS
jgi:chromosomal replication initiation ATPase DnaA